MKFRLIFRLITKYILICMLIGFMFIMVIKMLVYDAGTLNTSEFGFNYKPYSRFVLSKEGFATNKFDEYGFNNENVNQDKKMVVFFGDSMTEALQVKRSDNFSELVRNSISNSEIETLNLGMSGNSLADYIATLENIKMKFIFDRIFILNYS